MLGEDTEIQGASRFGALTSPARLRRQAHRPSAEAGLRRV
jgi:hypothetical protein